MLGHGMGLNALEDMEYSGNQLKNGHRIAAKSAISFYTFIRLQENRKELFRHLLS